MQDLYHYVQNRCNQYANKPLIILEDGCRISYSEFYFNLQKANSWIENQFPNFIDNTFSIIAPNCPQYLYFLFASLSKGNKAVNLNPALTNYEISERFKLTNTQVLITTKELFQNLKPIIKDCNISIVIFLNTIIDSFKNPEYEIIAPLIPNFKSDNNASFLQFTGGTTGIIKAAMISNDNILSNIEQLTNHFRQYRNLDDMRVLIAFPFYHIFSIVFNFLFFLNNGGCCILYKDLRNTDLIIKLIKENEINFTVAVNTWYKKLMSHPQFESINFSNIITSLAGGEYVPLTTKEQWHQKTGKPLYSAYGLTETSSLAIVSPIDDTNLNDTIGVAIPETIAILLDENNIEVLEDDIPGEIALKGPQVTSGYFNNIEETDKAFYNDWFKTGDIAVRKNNKFYKIIDRKKDMISVSGNKAYPNEIEEVILNLEGVVDVAAIGKKSDLSGEEVAICIVVKQNPKIDDYYIFEHCRKFLSKFKVPKYIFRYDELPKTPIGKTDRKKLREQINRN